MEWFVYFNGDIIEEDDNEIFENVAPNRVTIKKNIT
jgi:hypothetical protein